MPDIDIYRARSAELVEVRRWRGGREWRPRPHAHPCCELIVLTSGAERVTVEGRTATAEVGDLCFYRPGIVHRESNAGDTMLEFYCVQFDWPECPRNMPHVIRDRQGRVLQLARWLNAENLPRYDGNEDYVRFFTGALVAELLRLVISPSHEVVDQVRRFVTDRIRERIRLDDLAVHCNLNKYYLVRKFRALTGWAPMEYVRDVRLDTALRMLHETDLPLRDVAPSVGFANEYHLSRLLKKRFGAGARELRKRWKNRAE